MKSNIDTLLENLTDITFQSKKVLQEGSDVVDRILTLQSRLTGSLESFNRLKLTEADKSMLSSVKKIDIDSNFKVYTYSNIHNSKKYDIQAGCNIDYVVSEILKHMDHPEKEFNPKTINEEAIVKTFNRLTRTIYRNRSMSIDDFKNAYQSVAFGGFRQTLVIPNVLTLSKLYERTPFIISYIDTNLINKQINGMTKYYSEVEDKFNKMAKNHPDLHISLNGYLACLETSIRNTLIMYKDIRSTFMKLYREYKKIFDEILRIDRRISNETISLQEFMNHNYENIFNSIDEVITENINITTNQQNIDNDSHLNQSLLSNKKSKSLESLLSSLTESIFINKVKTEEDIKYFESKYGIISRIKNSNSDNIYRIYNNIINKIDMSNFISKLDTKIDFCKNQFEKLIQSDNLSNISITDILKELFTDSFIDINDDILKVYKDISSKIKGDIIYTKLTNLDYLFDNILNIPSYMKDISKHSIDIDNLIIELLNNIKNDKYKIDENRIDLVINKIIKAYLRYNSIIFCIYKTLYEFENESINLVQKFIDDNDL